ncbi:MAG: ImmA/IrrE family metallo-endopeptidase [Candidatus Sulfotelmatobacter sp.]|jgi:Zn-dependent peptidase ImmA (M78 family)/DNA-binding XRE family transcriptional regulator
MSGNLFPNQAFWGERLQVAREFKGITQKELADQVAASPALISLCEKGKKPFPARDLVEAFADVLGFEPEFFYGGIEDVFREEECSFRHRRSTPERLKNKIRAHATLIGMVIKQLRSVLRFPQQEIPHLPASTVEEIEAAAEECRRHWKLELDAPINQIGRVMERAGIVVIPHVVQSDVDAFSRCGPTAIIFLNQAVRSTSRWHFDIGHECGHLVMHPGIHTGTIETENAANRFASAFLMPSKAFTRDFRMEAFDWKHVFALKRRWRTSAQAIVRRGYDLGLLGAVDYRKSFKYMSWRGWTSNGEPDEPSFQEPELLSMALNSLGAKVDLTIEQLSKELHFKPQTFKEITGVSVPASRVTPVEVIPFVR